MEPLPEKPKREHKRKRRANPVHLAGAVLVIIGLSVPFYGSLLTMYSSEQAFDLVMLTIVICSALYLLYQGALWLMDTAGYNDDELDLTYDNEDENLHL